MQNIKKLCVRRDEWQSIVLPNEILTVIATCITDLDTQAKWVLSSRKLCLIAIDAYTQHELDAIVDQSADYAIESNNIDIIKILIKHPKTTKLLPLETQLGRSCVAGNKHAFDLLIDHLMEVSPHPNKQSLEQSFIGVCRARGAKHLFRMACTGGSLDIVKRLLQDERVKDNVMLKVDGICEAATRGHIHIIEALVLEPMVKEALHQRHTTEYERLNDPPECRTKDSPLVGAAYSDDLKMVKYLVETLGLDPSKPNNLPLYVSHGGCDKDSDVSIVEYLLSDNRVNPATNNNMIFIEACRSWHPILVKLLLQDKRVDPTIKNNKPLDVACQNDRPTVIKLLLSDERVDPSIRGMEFLLESIKKKRMETVTALLSCDRFDISDDKIYGRRHIDTIYRHLVEERDIGTLDVLLSNKRFPSPNSSISTELLELALEYRRFDLFRRILSLPSTDPSDYDHIIFEKCIYRGYIDLVKCMLEDKRVDPGFLDGEALCSAAHGDRPEMLEILLKVPGLTPSIRNNSALTAAARAGSINCVKLLLSDNRFIPEGAHEAVIVAVQYRQPEVLAVLLNDPRIDITHHIKRILAVLGKDKPELISCIINDKRFSDVPF